MKEKTVKSEKSRNVLAFITRHAKGYLHWIALAILVSAVGIALSVLVKYALYNPENRKVDVPLAAAVGMAGIIIPPFLPVTLLMPWAYYGAARENLNRYLHAYNR